MFASDALFWNTNGSRRAQSAARQIGLPSGTAPCVAIACATAWSWAHVFGAFWCALLSIVVLISIASGDQSFGKPYICPPTLNAFSRLGKKGFVLYFEDLMNEFSGSSTPCFAQVEATLEST